MRWIIGTLLAAAQRPRHRVPALIDAVQQPSHPLTIEEYKALAGIWRAELELDDGDSATTLHLAVPLSSAEFGGKVQCTTVPSGPHDAWFVEHSIRVGDSEDSLCLSLQLGALLLEGRGERHGLRCCSFVGTVLEGYTHDPCMVGRFSMQLSLPIASDLAALEQQHELRLDSRTPTPLTYPRSGFIGQWRLDLAVDEDEPPASIPVELLADGSWQSVGMEQRMGGTWGMLTMYQHAHADSTEEYSGWSTLQPAGSSMWLKVHRARCTGTMRGLAGLPVRSDFHLTGAPVFETAERELAARASALAAGEVGRAGAAVMPDVVCGRLWEGSIERAYFGHFRLAREGSARNDAPYRADVSSSIRAEETSLALEEARQALELALGSSARMREEEARRALEEAGRALDVAKRALQEAMGSTIRAATVPIWADEEAATVPIWVDEEAATVPIWADEEAAKRAWLAKLDRAPRWGLLGTKRYEEVAKRAWLAKLDAAQSWGKGTYESERRGGRGVH